MVEPESIGKYTFLHQMAQMEEDLIVWATQMVVIGAKGGPFTTTHALTIQMGKGLWMHSKPDSLCHSRGSICQMEYALR